MSWPSARVCCGRLSRWRPSIGLNGVRFMRDPTRGGLATVAHEIGAATSIDVRLFEAHVPVRDSVRSVCQILGYVPYYLACDGRVSSLSRRPRQWKASWLCGARCQAASLQAVSV